MCSKRLAGWASHVCLVGGGRRGVVSLARERCGVVMAVFSAGRCWVVLLVVFVLVCGMVGADPSGAVDGSSDGSGVAAVAGFDDVGGGGVHAPAVDALAGEGVFEGTGCGDGMFCPGEPILRWVMAVWLVRVLDAAAAEGGGTRFADVDAGVWWAPYVETLADLGVTKGCATGPLRFCPQESVTRAQMASFLVRAFGLEAAGSAGFVDTAGNTHEPNIDALAAGRVTAGCATGPLRYCPAKAVTRAQMATFLARATGLVALPDGDSGGGQEPEPVVDEAVGGFDPFTTPTLSDLDLDRLAVAVATLDETVECPPVVAPESLDDVAEVVRIADGCLIVEYEPLNGRTVAQVREALSADPTVHAVGVPPRDVYLDQASDSLRHNQWFLDKDAIDAEVLWDSWPTGPDVDDVIVAVIDSGVDSTHPDLDANVLPIGNACHRDPNRGHGTHVAGIIAAERNNAGAVVGVAPNAKILPIKLHVTADFLRYVDDSGVLQKTARDPSCHGDVPTLTVAITRAVNEGADVINMSLRWSLEEDAEGQDTVELAIRAATMKNVVAVTSAGNCGAPAPPNCRMRHMRKRPAVYPGVITVAATDESNLRAVYSTSNRDVDIAAPGGGGGSPFMVSDAFTLILSTWPDDDMLEEDERCRVASATGTRTCWTRGTSMAAAVVSGVVAHMKAHYPDATVNDIQYALYSTALNTDDSSANFRNDYGHGFINPVAAIGALQGLELGKHEYTDVSAGQSHSCGLRTNGTIDCWGNNDYGQTDVPERIFKKLDTGANHTCGVRLEDGAIKCWGADNEGQTGIQAKGTPFIPLGPYRDVAAGQFHTCGLRTDNTITCWGAVGQDKGQTKPPAGNFYAVSAGRFHTCGIQRPATRGITDGGGAVKCWGDNTYNQTSKTPTGKFIAISAGGYHTCGRRPELTIECWGNTAHGLVNDIPPGKFRSVSAGWFHTCGIQQTTAKAISGPVKCWGRNAFGRTDAPSDDNFTAITAGNFHTCGILDSETKTLTRNVPDHPTLTYDHPIISFGTIKCWGNNNHNQTDAPAPGKSTTDTTDVAGVTDGRIAFASNRDGDYEIFVMNPDGSDQQQITHNEADDEHPGWSPDSARMVFASDRDGDSDIYVMDADGSNAARLTDNDTDDAAPLWSPDGTRIVFYSDADGDDEVYVMNIDGSDLTQLTHNEHDDLVPNWSPDSGRITFSSDRDDNWNIYVMNADGTNQQQLTDHPDTDWHPSWSPDGTQIVFMSRRTGDPEIFVMDADGTNQRQLTNNGKSSQSPYWSPTGTRIVFSQGASRFSNTDIYTMDADGTNEQRIDMRRDNGMPNWGSP